MSKQSLKERLKKRREDIAARGGNSFVNFIKEGTTRIRVLPVGDDEDWAYEVVHFYLGQKIKGVFSPATIGADCPILKAYKELSEGSGKDQDIAKQFTPRNKYVVPAIIYEDDKGKKIDDQKSGKLTMIPNGIYAEMIDCFLDTELGDFTDPKEGYDFKIIRTGKGKNDTEYSLMPMRPSSIPATWHKPVDLEEMVKAIVEPYDSAEEKLDSYLLTLDVDDNGGNDESPKSSKSSKSKLKRRKKNG